MSEYGIKKDYITIQNKLGKKKKNWFVSHSNYESFQYPKSDWLPYQLTVIYGCNVDPKSHLVYFEVTRIIVLINSLRMTTPNSYLDDFTDKMITVPNDINRFLRLIRKLDKKAEELQTALIPLQTKFLAQIK